MEYSVSILIPTYNRANLRERAINSSLKQKVEQKKDLK